MENEIKYGREENGRFKIGKKQGRPKGAINRKTKEHLQRVQKVMQILDEDLEVKIREMKGREKVQLFVDLTEYLLPKLQRVNLEKKTKEEKIRKVVIEVIRPGEKPKEEE